MTGARRWRIPDGARTPNPIMVKELRQFARSRVLIGTVLSLLAGLLIAVGGFAAAQGAKLALGVGSGTSGGALFAILLSILFYTGLFIVPIYCATRLSAERAPGGLDLLFTTALRPGAIVRGKLYAAAAMTLLVYSVALPFLMLTYLLRGIDLPTILVATAGAFFATVCAAQFGIFFGALPISRALKIVFFALFGLQALFAVPGLFITMALTPGARSSPLFMMTDDFWSAFGLSAGFGGAWLALFYAAAVTLLMPPAANRARPLRATLSGLWAVGGAIACAAAAIHRDSSYLVPWVVFAALFCILFILMATSERWTLGPRVRREIPRARWRRALARPFFSGTVGGLLWALLVGAITAIVCALVDRRWPDPELKDALETLGLATLYVWGYAMTGIWVWRLLLGRHVPYRLTWMIALAGVVIGSVIPAIAAVIRETQGYGPGSVQLFNLFALADDTYRREHATVALAFAGLTTLLVAPSLARQWREFKPYDISPDNGGFAPSALPPLGAAPVFKTPEPPPLPAMNPATASAPATADADGPNRKPQVDSR